MFQYALGRTLAIRYDAPLKLDISWFESRTERFYGLDKFNICADVVTNNELTHHFGLRSGALFQSRYFRLRESLRSIGARRLVNERHFHVDEHVFRTQPPVYLNGCWQSERYFLCCGEQIRRDFALKNNPIGSNKDWLSLINNKNSVCVHVRRGDYIMNQQFNQIHGTCEPAYYLRARDTLSAIVNHPIFFVFSDDLEWAKANISFLEPVYWVDENSHDKDYEDFRLMCACRHFIIANSSLSWWAAWMGLYHEKTIIAPRVWFRTTDRDTKDMYPANWLLI